ncbi:MAG: SGNH/GDSL hydrolase family protein, partial [Candidatus Omnitrophica bacterium]|nr:SGNH/GDSL hydrolase family protein [Candidatus Omnitrophota bacterium]MBU1922711.1 SGNH/GDSL hydrolase family protein [Candidatus Omnitrophota bacterium]
FREDTDTNPNKTKGVVRVLVTGDSQVDGTVNNNESFPHVLESKLNSGSQTTKFEFLNGGVGSYGPDQYFLFLNKYLFLDPDIYIICIYTGNDFMDSARILEDKNGLNERPEEYFSSLRNCLMLSNGAINQVANQIYYFKTFPQMREKSVKHALELIIKIDNYCKQHNIDFILVFLPTKADVEWQSDGDVLEKVKNCLALSESDLKINRELTQTLIQGVLRNNISFIDFYDPMKNKNVEFYWKKDYHLNNRAHSFIAEKIYEKYYSFFIRSKR